MVAEGAEVEAGLSPGPMTPLRVGLAALGVVVLAFALYWVFLRSSYDPVLRSLPPEDAADVVKVLEAKKIAYRLADGGTTILVPSDQADKARIELVGSELPMRGQVGFELFNQSDMGLTEFAQKINYQRALQGELARTLLMLDGIHSVRVHLGLAERSLFRDEQSSPKASVALVLKPGNVLTESRVGGIQRLVAGAVPDLAPDAVAVLDETGKVVSRAELLMPPPATASEARLQLHRANIMAALKRAYAGQEFGITVSLASAKAGAQGGDGIGTASESPVGDSIRVVVTTSAALDSAVQRDVAATIRTGVSPAQVETVLFAVGDPAPMMPAAAPWETGQSAGDQVVAKSVRGAGSGAAESGLSAWLLIIPLVVAAVLAALWSDRRRRRRDRQGLESFTDQLRERLAMQPVTT